MAFRYESPSNDPAVAAQEALHMAGYRGEEVTLVFSGTFEWDDSPVTVEVEVAPGDTAKQVVQAMKDAAAAKR